MTRKLLLLSMAIMGLVIVSVILRNDPLALAPLVFAFFVAVVLLFRIIYLGKSLEVYRKAVRQIQTIIDEEEEPHRMSATDLKLTRIKIQCRVLNTFDEIRGGAT